MLRSVKSDPQAVSNALGMMSQALEILQSQKFNLTKASIDNIAVLNAQSLTLEKILEPLKASIKNESLQQHRASFPGLSYEAVVISVSKTVLDVPKVMSHLGKLLPGFQRTQQETRVSFRIKS